MESFRKTPYLLALLFIATPYAHLVLPHSHIPLSFIILSLMLATADKNSPHITFGVSILGVVIQLFLLHRVGVPMNLIHFIALMATMALFLLNDQNLQQSLKKYRRKQLELDMTKANSSILRELIRKSIGKETTSDTAREVIKTLIQYYHFENCTVFIAGQHSPLVVKGTTATSEEIIPLETIAQERLMEMNSTGKSSVYKDKAEIAKCIQSLKRNVHYSYFYSFWEQKTLMGALLVENKGDKALDKTIQSSFFKLTMDTIQLCLKNVMNHEHVIRLTMTDSMTGAFNQQYLDRILNQKLEEYKNTGKSFALAMVDIDRLGQLNQEYGQAFGDMAVKELVTFIQQNIRLDAKGDMLFRYGSDKFIVYFADVKAASIFDPLESLRNKLSNLKIKNDLGQSATISASFGLVEYPANGSTVRGLLENAEEALKKSKDKGRNSITAYDELKKQDRLSEFQYLLDERSAGA